MPIWGGCGCPRLELREKDRKPAALAQFAFQFQGTAMTADDMLDDGEPQPGAAQIPRAGGIHPIEALGKPRQMPAVDAFTLVDDRHGHGGPGPGQWPPAAACPGPGA